MVRRVRSTITRHGNFNHITVGIAIKGKGKGKLQGNPTAWTVVMQAVISEEAVDGDVVLEHSGNTTHMTMNSLSALSYDVTAQLNAMEETLVMDVEEQEENVTEHAPPAPPERTAPGEDDAMPSPLTTGSQDDVEP